jgi:hypothetical protein
VVHFLWGTGCWRRWIGVELLAIVVGCFVFYVVLWVDNNNMGLAAGGQPAELRGWSPPGLFCGTVGAQHCVLGSQCLPPHVLMYKTSTSKLKALELPDNSFHFLILPVFLQIIVINQNSSIAWTSWPHQSKHSSWPILKCQNHKSISLSLSSILISFFLMEPEVTIYYPISE